MDRIIKLIPSNITQEVDSIQIDLSQYTLGKSALFSVLLLDNTLKVLIRTSIFIEGEEFQSWGADDDYIINLILSKFGLTKDQTQPSTEQQPISEIAL